MVLRLTPDQCSSYWEDLSAGIRDSMPPFAVLTEEGMNNVLAKLLTEAMQAWVVLDENKDVVASAITMFQEDFGTGGKQLLIYSLFGYKYMKPNLYNEGLTTLKDFARSFDCQKVIAYTSVPRVVEVAKTLGAQAEYVFMSWEV